MRAHVLNNAPVTALEDLRSLAFLKHQIAVASADQQLWTAYAKFGSGQWETPASVKTKGDRRFWPAEAKTKMASSGKDEQTRLETGVQAYVQELNKSIQQYHCEYDEGKRRFDGPSVRINEAIDMVVQKFGMPLLQMKLKYRLAMVEYDYETEILERDYVGPKPTEAQVGNREIDVLGNSVLCVCLFRCIFRRAWLNDSTISDSTMSRPSKR